jgi:hypothetical protein
VLHGVGPVASRLCVGASGPGASGAQGRMELARRNAARCRCLGSGVRLGRLGSGASVGILHGGCEQEGEKGGEREAGWGRRLGGRERLREGEEAAAVGRTGGARLQGGEWWPARVRSGGANGPSWAKTAGFRFRVSRFFFYFLF